MVGIFFVSDYCQMLWVDEPPESVGKVRAAADLAFSKGQSEESARLWGRVLVLILDA